jgi:anti-anti-sigma regulatory factor
MLEISLTQVQSRVPVTVMHLKGDLDTTGCEVFDARAQEVVAAGAKDVLIDLTHVPFVSSAGIRSIHRLFYQLHPEGSAEHKRIMDEGIRQGTYKAPHMKLFNPSPRVFNLLEMMSMDMYIDILTGKEAELKEVVSVF